MFNYTSIWTVHCVRFFLILACLCERESGLNEDRKKTWILNSLLTNLIMCFVCFWCCCFYCCLCSRAFLFCYVTFVAVRCFCHSSTFHLLLIGRLSLSLRFCSLFYSYSSNNAVCAFYMKLITWWALLGYAFLFSCCCWRKTNSVQLKCTRLDRLHCYRHLHRPQIAWHVLFSSHSSAAAHG